MSKKERIEELESQVSSLQSAIGRIWEWIEADDKKRDHIIQEREMAARMAEGFAKQLLAPSYFDGIIKVRNPPNVEVVPLKPDGPVGGAILPSWGPDGFEAVVPGVKPLPTDETPDTPEFL